MSPWAYRHDSLSNNTLATKKSVFLATSRNRQLQNTSTRQGIANVGKTASITVASQIPARVALKESLSYTQHRHAHTSMRYLTLCIKPPPRLHHCRRSPPLHKRQRRPKKHANADARQNFYEVATRTLFSPCPSHRQHFTCHSYEVAVATPADATLTDTLIGSNALDPACRAVL
jgi:hypothetical protein